MTDRCLSHILHPIQVQKLVTSWLEEDTPNFDYGGFVVGEETERALLLCKSPGVLAGCPFFEEVFRQLGCEVTWSEREGADLEPVSQVAEVTGKVRHLLLGERVALNVMARASGIATLAKRLGQKSRACGWTGRVAGTRKTTPGFRMVEKYALLVGGVDTHRYDLSSMIMLKDNHIWTAGNITKAVLDARSVAGFSSQIEVECRSREEAMEAATAGADVVMLDNFQPEALHKAAAGIKMAHPGVLIEASGGITEASLTSYCSPHIDVISLSKLTQGYDVVDFSLKIAKPGRNPQNPVITS